MHWGHLDTYICYHKTLTFSKVFIRLTTIKTTNCTCNTQSKKKKKKNCQCNISNVAKLFDSTYEISHLILQYFRQSIHRKADTRQSLWIISHMWGTKEAVMVVSRSTTNREILFGFLKKYSHMCKTENFWLAQINNFPSLLSLMQLGFQVVSSQYWS